MVFWCMKNSLMKDKRKGKVQREHTCRNPEMHILPVSLFLCHINNECVLLYLWSVNRDEPFILKILPLNFPQKCPFYLTYYSIIMLNMTALLEYLSVLLEYIDLFSTFNQHLYISSYKLFLVGKSNLSLSLLKVDTHLNSTNYCCDIQLF